jgi:hypothetical protein
VSDFLLNGWMEMKDDPLMVSGVGVGVWRREDGTVIKLYVEDDARRVLVFPKSQWDRMGAAEFRTRVTDGEIILVPQDEDPETIAAALAWWPRHPSLYAVALALAVRVQWPSPKEKA